MLKLHCISTGSGGNSYILYYKDRLLILDLGVKYRTFLTALDKVDNIDGALITHEHSDHDYRGAKHRNSEIVKNFTTVLTPKNSEVGKTYLLGEFKVIPVEHKHNVKCYGYIIKAGNEIIYYATDMAYPIKFDNLKIDHFLIECNYINSIREKELMKNDSNTLHLNELIKNHCSLETLVDYFGSLDYKPKNILTIHSSNSNLFSRELVETELKDFADNVGVVFNNRDYILKGKE